MADNQSSIWRTTGIVERLTALWTAERKSSSEIREILAREFRVSLTRNAVIGKLDRLGLFGKAGAAAGRPIGHQARRSTISLAGGAVFSRQSGVLSPPRAEIT